MIKAIIFDFGNVICKFDNNLFIQKISKWSDKSSEEINHLIYEKTNFPELYETGSISSDEFFQKISSLCNLKTSKEQFIEAYTNIFSPINSTFELIKKLSKKYKLALLSNTSEWDFNFSISRIEIFDFFDAVSLSFEVNAKKPDDKIFNDCLKKLNLQAKDCIYIDDIKEYSDKATELGMLGINYVSYNELLKSLRALNIEI